MPCSIPRSRSSSSSSAQQVKAQQHIILIYITDASSTRGVFISNCTSSQKVNFIYYSQPSNNTWSKRVEATTNKWALVVRVGGKKGPGQACSTATNKNIGHYVDAGMEYLTILWMKRLDSVVINKQAMNQATKARMHALFSCKIDWKLAPPDNGGRLG